MKTLYCCRKILKISFALLICASAHPTLYAQDIVPLPQQVEQKQGSFEFTAGTMAYAIDFPQSLGALTELLPIPASETRPQGKAIVFKKAAAPNDLQEEGYRLSVSEKYIVIEANTEQGAFYAVQSLRQLLPGESFETGFDSLAGVTIPAVAIEDQPRFVWRGFMLDSCRHIQSIERIKQYLDLMALYKLNVFHWHLTEDQAWRMEIKKYPKLASVGGFPIEAGKDDELNGYYTQEQMKEIVAYAHARHIKVVPEFDIPGHINALLVAYPEYGCDWIPKPLPIGTGSLAFMNNNPEHERYAICAGQHEKTLPLIMDVFEEMAEIFPDAIFHIGGDERPKGVWEKCSHCQAQREKLGLADMYHLQNWYLNEISERLRKCGIRSIAWAEHLKGGIPENQIVQAWRTPREAPDAVRAGHQVVNSLHTWFYLDYPAHATDLEKHADWMRNMRVSTKSIYHKDPVPGGLTDVEQELIIGVEAPVWTETIKDDRLDLKVFPRLLSLAEIAWTNAERKSWPSFQERFAKHSAILTALDIEYDTDDTI